MLAKNDNQEDNQIEKNIFYQTTKGIWNYLNMKWETTLKYHIIPFAALPRRKRLLWTTITLWIVILLCYQRHWYLEKILAIVNEKKTTVNFFSIYQISTWIKWIALEESHRESVVYITSKNMYDMNGTKKIKIQFTAINLSTNSTRRNYYRSCIYKYSKCSNKLVFLHLEYL